MATFLSGVLPVASPCSCRTAQSKPQPASHPKNRGGQAPSPQTNAQTSTISFVIAVADASVQVLALIIGWLSFSRFHSIWY